MIFNLGGGAQILQLAHGNIFACYGPAIPCMFAYIFQSLASKNLPTRESPCRKAFQLRMPTYVGECVKTLNIAISFVTTGDLENAL